MVRGRCDLKRRRVVLRGQQNQNPVNENEKEDRL